MSMELHGQRLSSDKIEVLKRNMCKGGSDDDLAIFLHACNRTGLDPYLRQIYSVPRDSWDKNGVKITQMTIQTGIDGYRLIAERSGKYMPGKEYTFSYDSNGNLATATAYVKKLGPDNQWHDIAHTVHMNEYAAKKKDGGYQAMWATKPHVMLGKCAESAVLRKAFPADLSGLYTSEEMGGDDDPTHSPKPKIETISVEATISHEEAKTLDSMIHPDDQEYKKNILDYYKINSFKELPSSKLSFVSQKVQVRMNDKLREEMNVQPTQIAQ